MKIFLGSDHRGYELKEKIFQWLVDSGYLVEDFGAYEYIKNDDYTQYAQKVASVISGKDRKKEKGERGILLCGSGVGVNIVANKFDGVRSSIGKSSEQVKAGRRDDDMNVLVIAADYTSEGEAKKMVKAFLETKFSGKKHHKKRLNDISKIEANN